MLMQRWDPEAGPMTVTTLLALVAGCAIGRVLVRAVIGWVESSLEVPYRIARNTVFAFWLFGGGVVALFSLLLGVGLTTLSLSLSVGLVVQASAFWLRHSVSLPRALLLSLGIVVIPIVVVATVCCTAFVVVKVLGPSWGVE